MRVYRSALLPMAFTSILVTVLSIQSRLGSDGARAASPFSVTLSSSSPPHPAFSLCTVSYHSISLFWRAMRMMMAMSSFFLIIWLLLRGPRLVVGASFSSPLFQLAAVGAVIPAPAVMGVVPSPVTVASVSALPVPVPVSVMSPGVGVGVLSRPVLPGVS